MDSTFNQQMPIFSFNKEGCLESPHPYRILVWVHRVKRYKLQPENRIIRLDVFIIRLRQIESVFPVILSSENLACQPKKNLKNLANLWREIQNQFGAA